jgi:hypothetical protein
VSLSRRHFVAAPALLLLPRAAWAASACKPVDLAKGIAFRRQNGTTGLARREADGRVAIDYVTNRGAWTDQRRVKNGVFEVERTVEESEEPMVGASAPTYSWSHSPKIITPEDGATWVGTVREEVEVTISDEAATVERSRAKWKAEYRCFDLREVKLSGCFFQALSVEASFTGKGGSRSQRWVYFPQLGLGLETVRDGKENGIIALTPA